MIAEFSDLAEQAHGSVILRYGNTAVLATAVMSERVREDIDYFPLTVEYEERFYAAGQILGSRFVRREGRPSEQAILSGRVVDRTIRPLFPQHIRNEVQVIITVLSYDGTHDPVFAGFVGASAALSISTLPFLGPLGISRIGIKNGETLINPDVSEFEHLDLDLIVATTRDKIAMVEAEGKQIKDEVVFEMIKKASANAIKNINSIFLKICPK